MVERSDPEGDGVLSGSFGKGMSDLQGRAQGGVTQEAKLGVTRLGFSLRQVLTIQ